MISGVIGESGEWDDMHGWSKFSGNIGLTAATLGYGLSGTALGETPVTQLPRAARDGFVQTWSSLVRRGSIEDAMFAQRTYRPYFSDEGRFANKTIDEVAQMLKDGQLKPSDVPVEYAYKDGYPIILNTRSAHALEQAGIPRSQWAIENVTDKLDAMARLEKQLINNKLQPPGCPNPVRNP